MYGAKFSKSLTVIATLAASSASAHITLENREATVGTFYKAVFAVPHGCAGSATVKIRVQIPEGVIGVKPMPKEAASSRNGGSENAKAAKNEGPKWSTRVAARI